MRVALIASISVARGVSVGGEALVVGSVVNPVACNAGVGVFMDAPLMSAGASSIAVGRLAVSVPFS